MVLFNGQMRLPLRLPVLVPQERTDFLAKLHCECLQGFHFARPMPLEAWLGERLPSREHHAA